MQNNTERAGTLIHPLFKPSFADRFPVTLVIPDHDISNLSRVQFFVSPAKMLTRVFAHRPIWLTINSVLKLMCNLILPHWNSDAVQLR